MFFEMENKGLDFRTGMVSLEGTVSARNAAWGREKGLYDGIEHGSRQWQAWHEKKRQQELFYLYKMTNLYIQLRVKFPDLTTRGFHRMLVELALRGYKARKGKPLAQRLEKLMEVFNGGVSTCVEKLLGWVEGQTNRSFFGTLGNGIQYSWNLVADTAGMINIFSPLSTFANAGLSGSGYSILNATTQATNLTQIVAIPLMSLAQLLTHMSVGLKAWNAGEMIQALGDLKIRHSSNGDACPIRWVIDILIDRKNDIVVDSAFGLHPLVALAKDIKNFPDAMVHAYDQATGTLAPEVKKGIAALLLSEARNAAEHKHRSTKGDAHPGGCQLAWLTLALLFGHGSIEHGGARAVAVVLSNDSEAIEAIMKKLW